MELTFMNDLGQSFVVEIDENMELENVMALLEAESGIPASEQSISYNGRELSNPKSTIRQLGVEGQSAMLFLRRKVATVQGGTMEQDAEMMRLQMLGDPQLMQQLREQQPDLADVVENHPSRFAETMRAMRSQMDTVNRNAAIERLNANPFDVEAQRKIEEEIRMQAVAENMTHALEYSPEFFGRVHMLYIKVEVNGHPVKAFVDSGAQSTIMTPECAEACGIMRLLDSRFAGVAHGVGTAKILGRIHAAQLKVADIFLPCAFTIMEGRTVDLLFGLDMLKAHQAIIDLKKNCLIIQDREVPFLPEHELPEKARDMPLEEDVSGGPSTAGPSSAGGSISNPAARNMSGGSFPSGEGRTLGAAPASRTPGGGGTSQPPAQASRFPEEHIKTIMDFGVSREMAISTLEAAGGNLDVAASLLF
ncbi:SNARE binding protein [Coprinopsis cinerea okayama7|uniref:DNA damage-inducible protein 1 n=1 Tax=Coprinopsis cinerea (strain Okayama-7 / 130 / ATCC MYA-4618 / FGSC 9003) TaxID=240176 RepID=A8NZ25_COPC7|nr:SNARE binding protein [Coprinopsis cinerea okayama7\|eukprot:XP_001837586.1 SNARE binding protein [Coprinopsis cinerea okayama7\